MGGWALVRPTNITGGMLEGRWSNVNTRLVWMASGLVDSPKIVIRPLPTSWKRHGRSSLDETDGRGGMKAVKTDTSLLARAGGHIVRRNEDCQGDDRRPFTFLPDG